MAFTFRPDQVTELKAKLDSTVVKTRQQAGRSLSYIEAWKAIEEANRIFGFDGWHRETVSIMKIAEVQRDVGKSNPKPGWGVGYMAKVRVTVGDIVREGTGCGSGIDVDLVAAHESAVKEAESDAMKRALMTFGNPFGLALYDKTQENVERPRDPQADEQYVSEAVAWIGQQTDAAAINKTWSAQLENFLALPADLQARLTTARDEALARISAKPTASSVDAREAWTNNSIAWIDAATSMEAVVKFWKDNNKAIKGLETYQLQPLERAKENAKRRLSGVSAPIPPRDAPINLDDEIKF